MKDLLELKLEKIHSFLDKCGYKVEHLQETDQLFFSLKDKDHSYPVFVKILESDDLQFMFFFTTKIKATAIHDLARYLHLLNENLPLLGFGMDERAKALFFRVVLPSENKAISTFHLKNYLKRVLDILSHAAPAVESAAAGELSFDKMLQDADKIKQKIGKDLKNKVVKGSEKEETQT